jgi:hypothetical protein
MLRKIVSGGQTGADRAALDFAIEWNIPHGGWVPKGRQAEDGKVPEKYRLMEMEQPRLCPSNRTERHRFGRHPNILPRKAQGRFASDPKNGPETRTALASRGPGENQQFQRRAIHSHVDKGPAHRCLECCGPSTKSGSHEYTAPPSTYWKPPFNYP